MPEPFKNSFNRKLISSMAKHFAKAWPEFNQTAFVKSATKNMKALELKERSVQITDAMVTFLPADFKRAGEIMLASLSSEEQSDVGVAGINESGITGWAIMPMAHYVGLYGLGHFDLSMKLFKEMTKLFSSEFGIRFFLLDKPDRTLSVLKKWARDSNHHVRRLVSEGIRPRLPWAMRLPLFIENPSPVISLLEALKDDKEEYVRRSVANNLNDIAKDHPNIVAQIAGRWLKGASKDRQKLVRHGCRTLIKQGHQPTLKALGYGPPRIKLNKLKILNRQVMFGNALEFELRLTSTLKRTQNLIIDYIIHHCKANGSTTPKVFKWKSVNLEQNATLTAKRKHAIRKITTRLYYPGQHSLEVVINGVSQSKIDFELVM